MPVSCMRYSSRALVAYSAPPLPLWERSDRIVRCDPGEGLQSIARPEPRTPTLSPQDTTDLHHDVFVRALGSLPRLEDPGALKGWLTMIAVHVARSAIARRRRRSWLWFLPGEELPEVDSGAASGEVRDALRATYAALERLPVDERIAFALRFVDGMELTEVAEACEVSLATVKRRLARACQRFEVEARKDPVLETWLEGGTRWGSPSDP